MCSWHFIPKVSGSNGRASSRPPPNQRHLAEAEAEVLRHVAKLVPEAEVPDGRHREVFKIDLSSMREK
jgi:hypothetical protein